MKDKQFKIQDGMMVQMAMVVWDLEEALERYTREFGWGPWDIWNLRTPELEDVIYKGVRVEELGLKIAVFQAGTTQIELVQPLYGASTHIDHLETYGESVHHVKLHYKDIPKALKHFEAQGIYPLQSGKFKEDVHVFLDTKEKYGIIWEIGNSADIGKPHDVYPKK